MSEKSFLKASLYFLGIVTISIWGILCWDYFHAGVPSHHLLARKDLPEISNWWGAILLPLVTYVLLNRIKKRVNVESDLINQGFLKQLLYAFLIAFLYAVSIAVSFTTGNSQISGLLFEALFIIALFFPIYKSEYILGFIIGLVYTFGGVLPIIIALFLATVGYLLYKFLRPVFIKIAITIGLMKKHHV